MLDRVSVNAIGRRDVLVAAFLCVMVAAVYWPVSRFDFVRFDDPLFISENPHAVAGLTIASAKWAVTSLVMSNYMPMSVLSALLDIRLWGLRPGPLHVVNVIFHGISTVEWYLLWVVMTGRRARSFCVAAVFALHPMHVEPVAWISCRGDMLCMMFSVATLLAYVGYVRSARKFWFAAAIVLFCLAILSKTIAMVLPGVMILLNVWPLCDTARRRRLSPRIFLELSPFVVLSVGAATLGLWARLATAAVSSSTHWSMADRVCNGLLAYGSYLVKAFWPEPMRAIYPLAFDYTGAAVESVVAILILLSIMVLRSQKRSPYLMVGWGWFFGTLLPTIGIVQTGPQAMADRYTYLPYIGLSIAVIWGGGDLLRSAIRNTKATTAVSAIIAATALIACGVDARRQLQYWHDSMALFSHASQYAPGDPILDSAMGTEYRLAGRPDLALQYYARSVAVLPNNADMQNNLGWVLVGIDPKQAIGHFQIAAFAGPNAQRWWSLGFAQQQAGQFAAASASYQRALQVDPSYKPARDALRTLPHSGSQ